jgi:hypothetical protein
MRQDIRGAMAVTALATALTAGCGSSSLASESPSQILAAAVSATKSASSYEISGTGNFGNGVTSMDFKVAGKNLSGSIVINGSTIDLVEVTDNIYMKAPASFYTSEGTSSSDASILASTWVEATSGSSVASDFSSLADITDVSSELTASGKVTSEGTGTVNGQSVVLLKDSAGNILAIATSGPAYPVQVKATGSTSGVLNLSNWNSIPAITAPPNPMKIPGS